MSAMYYSDDFDHAAPLVVCSRPPLQSNHPSIHLCSWLQLPKRRFGGDYFPSRRHQFVGQSVAPCHCHYLNINRFLLDSNIPYT